MSERTIYVFSKPDQQTSTLTKEPGVDGSAEKTIEVVERDFLFTTNKEDIQTDWKYEGELAGRVDIYGWRSDVIRHYLGDSERLLYRARLKRVHHAHIWFADTAMEYLEKQYQLLRFGAAWQRALPKTVIVLIALGLLVAFPHRPFWELPAGFFLWIGLLILGIATLSASISYFSRTDVFTGVDNLRHYPGVGFSGKYLMMLAMLVIGLQCMAFSAGLLWTPLYFAVWVGVAIRLLYLYSQRPEPKVEEVKVAPPPPPPPPEPPKTTVERVIEARLKKRE